MDSNLNDNPTLDIAALAAAVKDVAAIESARVYLPDGTMYLEATRTIGTRIKAVPPIASGSTRRGNPYRTYRKADVYATTRKRFVVHSFHGTNIWDSEDQYSTRSYESWEALWRAAEDDDSLLEALESRYDALMALPEFEL